MEGELSLKETQKEYHGTLKGYIIGFVSSLVLTAISFLLVITKLFAAQTLIYWVIALALIQAIVQIIFFLHLGQEDKPRWETIITCFMVVVLLIIAIGSLWVMNDLNERMMSDMNKEMAQ